MEKRKYQIVIAAAAVLLIVGVAVAAFQLGAVASAQEGTVLEQVAVSGDTATLLQYQGRLSDPGTGKAMADGNYTMTLRLYSAPSGGTPLWTEVKDVPLKGGLFSTVLGSSTELDQALFDGRALWLGIKVGTDEEATPRQQVLPVAYALGLLPGAAVKANSSSAALSVSNTGSGEALVVDGDLTVEGNLSGGAHYHPDLVTNYELDDHLYGGMHNGRAIAYGSIDQFGNVSSASGNVTSKWVKIGNTEYYEITIDGHSYDQRYYVTTVTSIFGFANAWDLDGKLAVGLRHPNGQAIKRDFHFVTFKP